MGSIEEWVRELHSKHFGGKVPPELIYGARQYDKAFMATTGRPLSPRVRREIEDITRAD